MAKTVIVLDGSQRSSLAAVRALGQRRQRVVVCSQSRQSLASASRWCRAAHVLPSACDDPSTWLSELTRVVEREQACVVFPMTDVSVMSLAGRDHLGGARIACPPSRAYEAVSDKASLTVKAEALGIPVPRTVKVSDIAQLEESLSSWSGPVVLKPVRSRYLSAGHIRSTSVAIADDPQQAQEKLLQLEWFGSVPCLLQEYIRGHGAGAFTVYGPEGAVAWFAHRRIREKPPSGGVSVVCESAALDPAIREYSQRLLDDVNWFGPAMVEFKIAPDGTPYLMEINGRFWGSLQLAIDCGVDFPWLFYQMIQGESVQGPSDYPVGRRLRWLMGDFDRLLLQLRGKGTVEGLSDKLKELARFLNFFERDTRLEVLRRDDLGPFRAELRHWVRSLGGG